MVSRVFVPFLAVLATLGAWADDPGPAAPDAASQPGEKLLNLLEGLAGDPSGRDAVEKSLRSGLQTLREQADETQPLVNQAQEQLEAASAKVKELETKVRELTEQAKTAQEALAEATAKLAAIEEQVNAAKQHHERLSQQIKVYEVSLELVQSLSSAPKAEAPGDPAAASEPAPEAVPAVFTGDRVNFNRDVRPILANNCFACHGPDENQRKAGLRLDEGESAFRPLKSGHVPIVPGNLEKSELIRRITASDPADRMPPPQFGKTLTPTQIENLKNWVLQGGQFEKHWAWNPPIRTEPPAVNQSDWPRNPIDNFILARLEREGLAPSEEADRTTLIRRVTLDLTGLPPTPQEVDDFLADSSPDAYEKVVDRLLTSPHYGEHMARDWLDVARYADTNGYHIDNERYMWRWRDWVIDAFNRNMPFDQFTVEQLAGDLLPDAGPEQIVATGFNRNHMITFEGGVIPEEYRVQYVVDRLNTTGTVFMGLTIGCAQCHEHKFDPISQREYYELYAFFNTIPESGSDGAAGNAAPLIKAPLPDQKAKLAELKEQQDAVLAEMRRPLPEIDAQQAAWETDAVSRLAGRWLVLDPAEFKSAGGATLKKAYDRSILAEGQNPAKDVYEVVLNTDLTDLRAIRLEALTHDSLPGAGAGRAPNSNFVLTEFEAEISPVTNPERADRITFVAANGDFSQPTFDTYLAIDGNPETGWGVDGGSKKEGRIAVFVADRPFGFPGGSVLRVRLKHESKFEQHNIGRFRLSVTQDPAMAPSELGPWYVNGPFVAANGKEAYETAYEPESHIDLAATYEDKRLKWTVHPELGDGAIHNLSGDVCATYLYRVIKAQTARTMTLLVGTNDAVKVWLNGRVIHDNDVQRPIKADQDKITMRLDAGENRLLMKVVNYGNAYAFAFRKADEEVGDVPLDVERILAGPAETRSDAQLARVRDFYRSLNWPEWKNLEVKLAGLRESEKQIDAKVPTVMVMREMEKPRETFVLARGQYDQPGEAVFATTPRFLPKLPESAPPTRLGLAKWLVDPSHPLTSRVIVNRFWQHYFGTGIVKTSEDFGVQGDLPSHPELLDWLATEFIRTGWDVKAMQKLIVTSATYRQASRVTSELLEKDPENRLLARGPRYRLDAEVVRDAALAISGLLVPKIGGPSVRPYQPAGLWEEVSYGDKTFTAQFFEQDHGEDLYRRSMYTFWKRQSPPPTMLIFDAPNRETCTARRARTNTPLQALVLLNDPQFVEAARFFAERMIKEVDGDEAARVAFAFKHATARTPTPEETQTLLDVYYAQLDEYKKDVNAALDLLAVGESKRNETVDPCEHAAWTTVASLILNLDETITKG